MMNISCLFPLMIIGVCDRYSGRRRQKQALLHAMVCLFFSIVTERENCLLSELFFCLIFLFVMSGFIWEIEIDGNYTQTDDILNSYLEENAIVPGMKKNKIDCEQIEKMLRQTYDDIIWMDFGEN